MREEERNQRQDLFVLASSYIGQLKAKSNEMIREIDFHQVSDKPSKETVNTATENKHVNGVTAPQIGKFSILLFGVHNLILLF